MLLYKIESVLVFLVIMSLGLRFMIIDLIIYRRILSIPLYILVTLIPRFIIFIIIGSGNNGIDECDPSPGTSPQFTLFYSSSFPFLFAYSSGVTGLGILLFILIILLLYFSMIQGHILLLLLSSIHISFHLVFPAGNSGPNYLHHNGLSLRSVLYPYYMVLH